MRYSSTVLKRILRRLEVAESIACFIGLLAATLLIFAQVINRYWLRLEIMWFSDIALYAFIFFMIGAAALTTWREGHIAVDYFHQKVFQEKPKGAAIHRLSMVVISIAVVCIFISIAYGFLLKALEYPEYGQIVMWFNTSWLRVIFFVALLFILIHLLVIARRAIGNLIKTYRPKLRE